METLKLTTLTLLVPFGWALPDTADACRGFKDKVIITSDASSETPCFPKRKRHAGFADLNDEKCALPEHLAALTSPVNTMILHQNLALQIDPCRLDLEAIGTR